MPGPGDPDDPEKDLKKPAAAAPAKEEAKKEEAKAPAKEEKKEEAKDAAFVQMNDPSTGPAIAICNGGNDGRCTEAEDVVMHTLRRPGRKAGPGDPDEIMELNKKDSHPAILS